MYQRYALVPMDGEDSSAMMEWSGKRSRMSPTTASSAWRSAMVTKSFFPFSWIG